MSVVVYCKQQRLWVCYCNTCTLYYWESEHTHLQCRLEETEAHCIQTYRKNYCHLLGGAQLESKNCTSCFGRRLSHNIMVLYGNSGWCAYMYMYMYLVPGKFLIFTSSGTCNLILTPDLLHYLRMCLQQFALTNPKPWGVGGSVLVSKACYLHVYTCTASA